MVMEVEARLEVMFSLEIVAEASSGEAWEGIPRVRLQELRQKGPSGICDDRMNRVKNSAQCTDIAT